MPKDCSITMVNNDRSLHMLKPPLEDQSKAGDSDTREHSFSFHPSLRKLDFLQSKDGNTTGATLKSYKWMSMTEAKDK